MRDIEIKDIPPLHPAARFYSFWESNLNAAGMVERARMKPMSMPRILPWMAVVNKVPKTDAEKADPALPDWQRDRDHWFTYKLCGTGFVNLIGQDLTNQKVGASQTDELALQSYTKIEAALNSGRPTFMELGMPVEGRDFIKIIRAVFPLTVSGTEPDQIIGIIAPTSFEILEN